MAGRVTFSYRDYGSNSKVGRVGFWIPTLVAGNITAQMGLVDALLAAINDVTIGNLVKDERVASSVSANDNAAAEPLAQRSIKWHVSMTDTNGNSVSLEIPAALLSGLLATDGDNMEPTAAERIALVSAIEAVVKSNDGEAVVVDRIYQVGRS